MDSILRYTEDDIDIFEIDGFFQMKVKRYRHDVIRELVAQTVLNASLLPKLDYHPQFVSTVIKSDEPIFFNIQYINENDDIPILIDIREVSVDEYLDAIIDNKYFKEI